MKNNIEEMNSKEVLALSEADLEKLKKLALAEAGVKIIEKPIEPEYEEMPERDEVWYTINNFGYNFYKKEEDARKICDLLNSIDIYSQDYRSDVVKIKTDYNGEKEIFNLSVEKKYSAKTIAEAKNIENRNKTLKTNYELLKKEYDNNYEAYAEIVDAISNKHLSIVQKYAELDRLYSKYLEYKEIDKTKAMDFFKKAYDVSDELEAYVYEKESIKNKK